MAQEGLGFSLCMECYNSNSNISYSRISAFASLVVAMNASIGALDDKYQRAPVLFRKSLPPTIMLGTSTEQARQFFPMRSFFQNAQFGRVLHLLWFHRP